MDSYVLTKILSYLPFHIVRKYRSVSSFWDITIRKIYGSWSIDNFKVRHRKPAHRVRLTPSDFASFASIFVGQVMIGTGGPKKPTYVHDFFYIMSKAIDTNHKWLYTIQKHGGIMAHLNVKMFDENTDKLLMMVGIMVGDSRYVEVGNQFYNDKDNEGIIGSICIKFSRDEWRRKYDNFQLTSST